LQTQLNWTLVPSTKIRWFGRNEYPQPTNQSNKAAWTIYQTSQTVPIGFKIVILLMLKEGVALCFTQVYITILHSIDGLYQCCLTRGLRVICYPPTDFVRPVSAG